MISLPAVLHAVMMLIALVWLFLLVKVPWDLYFAARRGRIDADESLGRGIAVAAQDRADLGLLERRLLVGALAVHVVSAAGIWIIGRLSEGLVNPSFAWLFLLSAAFRPLHAVYEHLRRRLAELSGRVRFPRDDVQTLLANVQAMGGRIGSLERDLAAAKKELETRIERADLFARQMTGRQAEDAVRLRERLAELSSRFEAAIATVSSDQELLKGVRAFARMFREQAA